MQLQTDAHAAKSVERLFDPSERSPAAQAMLLRTARGVRKRNALAACKDTSKHSLRSRSQVG